MALINLPHFNCSTSSPNFLAHEPRNRSVFGTNNSLKETLFVWFGPQLGAQRNLKIREKKITTLLSGRSISKEPINGGQNCRRIMTFVATHPQQNNNHIVASFLSMGGCRDNKGPLIKQAGAMSIRSFVKSDRPHSPTARTHESKLGTVCYYQRKIAEFIFTSSRKNLFSLLT